jgi:hypothetical protein
MLLYMYYYCYYKFFREASKHALDKVIPIPALVDPSRPYLDVRDDIDLFRR